MKQTIFKSAIVVFLFLLTLLVFKLLQKPAIFFPTLGNITHTYSLDTINKKNAIVTDIHPYDYLNNENTVKWDAIHYNDIRLNYYSRAEWTYSFFPLFPLFWKISQVPPLYIGLLNYLLFGIAIILFSILLFNAQEVSPYERMCAFVIALVLPTIVSFYLPYPEALFIITFALALWGLVKKKYWMFFIFFALAAMARPIFVTVGLAIVMIEIFYFIKHRNIKHFLKHLSLALAPLLVGTCIVFFMYYLNSGSFTKYFATNFKYWKVAFSIPQKISDWSSEGYGMNVFTVCFVIIPSAFLLLNNFIKLLKSEKSKELQTIFNGNLSFTKEYFFNFSIIYFWGIFFYVLFFQKGSLNGLSRYILATPFFYIYLFCAIPMLKNTKWLKFAIGTAVILVLSLLMFQMFPKHRPSINFNDSGFITLFLDLIFLFTMKYMNKIVKIVSLTIITFYSIVWITYLYNIYIHGAWIFT